MKAETTSFLSAPQRSCVLLIDPTKQHAERLPRELYDSVAQSYGLLERATQVVSVPRYFACPKSATGDAEWLLQPSDAGAGQIYVWSDGRSPWSNDDLTSSLYSENRPNLFIGGFWLDDSVTFAALSALADGYETYLLVDISIARTPVLRESTIERLLQAGVVPTTTVQVVSEWMAETPDASTRAKLQQMVSKSFG